MSAITRLASRIYGLLVRLYPRPFRQEFGEEMRAVFADAAADAAGRGIGALLALCLRELRDWPRAVLSEYWVRLKTWRRRAQLDQDTDGMILDRRLAMPESLERKRWSMEGPRHAVMAALPPLLFGVGVAAAHLLRGAPWYEMPRWRLALGVIAGLLPSAAIALGALLALMRRLPDWGWTWVGSTVMGLFLLAQVLGEELVEERGLVVPPAVESVVGIGVILVVLAVLGVAALRRWQVAGLTSIGLCTIMGLSLCAAVANPPFGRRDLALLAAPAGLLFAVLIYVYGRGSLLTRIAVLAGVGTVNVGLTWMAGQVWGTWLASRGSPSPVAPVLLILTGLLLAGPVVGLLGRPLRRAIGRA